MWSNEDATANHLLGPQAEVVYQGRASIHVLKFISPWNIHTGSASFKNLFRGKTRVDVFTAVNLSEHIWGPSLSFWFLSKFPFTFDLFFSSSYYSIKTYLESQEQYQFKAVGVYLMVDFFFNTIHNYHDCMKTGNYIHHRENINWTIFQRAISQYWSRASLLCIFFDSMTLILGTYFYGKLEQTCMQKIYPLSFFPVLFTMARLESHLKYKLVRILSNTSDQPESSLLKQKRVFNNWGE